MNLFKRLLKWSIIISLLYFVFTTLYFGYDDIDANKGMYKFYWSGLRGIWEKNRDFGFKVNKVVPTHLDGVDGPYVVNDSVFYTNEYNEFYRQKYVKGKPIIVRTESPHLNEFSVRIKDSITIENDTYEMPEKLIAISDIEGNFDALYSFLFSNKVIDKHGNWIFGNGHVVFNGDFMDRGKQVTQVLWLIYSLEHQAETHGGKVHFILGNHEVMNMYGDVSYNDFKYIEVAKRVSKKDDWDKSLQYLYSAQSELGKWLRTKNIVEKIGDFIFVHGGLNLNHVKKNYTISEFNTVARRYYGITPDNYGVGFKDHEYIINATESPYWDRRLNLDLKYMIMYRLSGMNVEPITTDELEKILSFYKASRMVIGHSVVDDIKQDYENKVIKIDVKHGRDFATGQTKGLLVDKGKLYKIDDLGQKQRL
ncbi:metallophosphoesterase [Flavobacterium sp.]|mgnify:CR=1 FL=1|uniref:metallophosphoesterase n=1 Tax=Flavobacterium sp. TaxID=239 RepID=UPI002FD95860